MTYGETCARTRGQTLNKHVEAEARRAEASSHALMHAHSSRPGYELLCSFAGVLLNHFS
jgi:hypothetical protein